MENNHWKILKQCLQTMPETGEDGFEGLIAQLLENLLDTPFIVAKTGTQPSGDVRNYKGDTCIQAKRYLDKTKLDSSSIERDFLRAKKTLPYLSVYIVAASRDASQLRDEFDRLEDQTGIDIVTLTLSDKLSDLGALCVLFWDKIRTFPKLREMDDNFSIWIKKEIKADSFVKKIKTIKDKLMFSIQTKTRLNDRANAYLQKRFECESSNYRRFSYEINISRSIRRYKLVQNLENWWMQSSKPVCYLEGEEGYGKSWLAAQFAHICSNKKEALIFWMDSILWTECHSLSDVFDTILTTLCPESPEKVEKWKQKILSIWKSPILLILDGVNERGGGVQACQKILNEYFYHETKYKKRIRIVFTTRPLKELYTEYTSNLWSGCHRIEVLPFDDDELTEALENHDPVILPSELSPSLRSISIIPRYFSTCIRLREKFRSLENITKEMVLWVDLQEKINTDEQIRKRFSWTQDKMAADVLSFIAKEAKWENIESSPTITAESIRKCFDNYSEIRRDLMEQRVAVEVLPTQVKLNPDHILLGWALYLANLIEMQQVSDVKDYADWLHQQLEPIASEDKRTEVLFIVLQLSAIQCENRIEVLSQKRAAILLAWMRSHNPRITEERLTFWVQEDLDAYLQVIEQQFTLYFTGPYETIMITPLAKIWKEQLDGIDILNKYLRKWLLLTWSEEDFVNNLTKATVDFKGFQLPVAENSDQLRLSAIAISIISQRPDIRMLETLAICRGSLDRCKQTSDGRPFPIKTIHENLGILIRWSYTEKIVDELCDLATANENNELMLKGIQGLAASLHIHELPPVLRFSSSKPLFHYTPTIKCFQEGNRIFPDNEPAIIAKSRLRDIDYIACRKDLPIWSPEDISKLKEVVQYLSKNFRLLEQVMRTSEDGNFSNLFPWFARYHPKDYGHLSCKALQKSLTYSNPLYMLCELYAVFFDTEDSHNITISILKKKELLINWTPKACPVHIIAEFLTEILLFTSSEEELNAWFNFLAEDKRLRKAVFSLPLVNIIRILASQSLRKHCWEKIKGIDTVSDGEEENISESEYWLQLYSLTHQGKTPVKWILERLQNESHESKASFCLMKLLLKSPQEDVFRKLWENDKLNKHLDRKGNHYLLVRWLSGKKIHLDISIEEMTARWPWDVVGCLLLASKHAENFKQWGRELLGGAISLCCSQAILPNAHTNTIAHLGTDNAISYMYNESKDETIYFPLKDRSSWGVDYNSQEECDEAFQRFQKISQEDCPETNQESDIWQKDRERLKSWPGFPVGDFNFRSPLDEWAKQNRQEFINLSAEYLEKLDDSLQHHSLGLLTDAILCILLPIDPNIAGNYYLKWSSLAIKTVVTTHCQIPEFIRILWDISQCNLDKHKELRRYLIEACMNDEEVMFMVIAALLGNGQKELWELIEHYLKNESARERSLSVSLLPWIGTQEAVEKLKTIKSNDPSDWVRNHAEWSYNVAQQEYSCRQIYRDALEESCSDLVSMSARIQQIKPALSPTARWWHIEIEQESFSQEKKNPRITAYLHKFWTHWGNSTSTKSNVKVFERKLAEYCRGEKIKKHLCSRMSPWWMV